jgi:hypothetical protein
MGYGTRIAFGALRGFTARLCLLVGTAVFVCAGAAFSAQAQVKETVLWTFSGGSDGSSPDTGVIADERGDLYGTTGFGGTFSAGCVGLGCGVVFKLTPPARDQIAWTETTLRSFSGGSDGSTPFGGLFARNQSPSSKKSLYGTTTFGGALDAPLCFGEGCGTVFKLTPPGDRETGWTLTTLWTFTGSDGGQPVGGLIADETRALYGMTNVGGINNRVCGFFGCGVVFKLTPPARGQTAWTELGLWSFTGGSDGASPQGGPLIADERGALYGTTQFGGALDLCSGLGCGVAFKLTGTGFVP